MKKKLTYSDCKNQKFGYSPSHCQCEVCQEIESEQEKIPKNLYRLTTIQVDGFEGNETKYYSYFLSYQNFVEDDKPVTQEDVVEADRGVFLEYRKFENLGPITETEIETLNKFKILI